MSNKMEYTPKHTFALLALWFMAPFMKAVNLKEEKLTDEQIQFVQWYIKAGYIVWGVLILIGLIALIVYPRRPQISLLTNALALGLGIFLIYFTFKILHDSPFTLRLKDLNLKSQPVDPKQIENNPLKFLYYYIPLYNLYLRYTQRQNPKVYRRVKESILLNIAILAIPNPLWFLIWGGFYIFRIISLSSGIDIIPDHIKQKLDQLFEVNIEEMWGYIKGFFVHLFVAQDKGNLQQYIQKAKQEYQKLYTTKDKIILQQYVIVLILLAINIIAIKISLYVLPPLRYAGRYALAIYLQKMPPIPLIHEALTYIHKHILKAKK